MRVPKLSLGPGISSYIWDGKYSSSSLQMCLIGEIVYLTYGAAGRGTRCLSTLHMQGRATYESMFRRL
jgi:hypothetical protein